MATHRQWASRLALAGALALAGCGDDDPEAASTPAPRTVDSAQIEQEITQQLSTTTAEVSKVKCPDDVESAAGATFSCTIKWSGGGAGKVKVTQASVGQFTYAPVSGSVRLPANKVEKSVEQALADDGVPGAQVTCPDPVAVKSGTTVTCTVQGASGMASGNVSFSFSDDSGSVDPASVEAG